MAPLRGAMMAMAAVAAAAAATPRPSVEVLQAGMHLVDRVRPRACARCHAVVIRRYGRGIHRQRLMLSPFFFAIAID